MSVEVYRRTQGNFGHRNDSCLYKMKLQKKCQNRVTPARLETLLQKYPKYTNTNGYNILTIRKGNITKNHQNTMVS